MKGFIEVYDQRTQFLKDIFLSHGYQINDKQSQNLDFYVVKNQKIDHDNTFSLNNINTKYKFISAILPFPLYNINPPILFPP